MVRFSCARFEATYRSPTPGCPGQLRELNFHVAAATAWAHRVLGYERVALLRASDRRRGGRTFALTGGACLHACSNQGGRTVDGKRLLVNSTRQRRNWRVLWRLSILSGADGGPPTARVRQYLDAITTRRHQSQRRDRGWGRPLPPPVWWFAVDWHLRSSTEVAGRRGPDGRRRAEYCTLVTGSLTGFSRDDAKGGDR